MINYFKKSSVSHPRHCVKLILSFSRPCSFSSGTGRFGNLATKATPGSKLSTRRRSSPITCILTRTTAPSLSPRGRLSTIPQTVPDSGTLEMPHYLQIASMSRSCLSIPSGPTGSSGWETQTARIKVQPIIAEQKPGTLPTTVATGISSKAMFGSALGQGTMS